MSRPGRPRKHDPLADEINQAIRHSNFTHVKSLITEDVVNIRDGEGRTPLFEAVIEDQLPIIKLLIEWGADINHQDRSGLTPLHFAVQNKSEDVIAFLLSIGANANLQDIYGNGPLWRATFDARGNYSIVEKLLLAGADPRHKNKSDKSPFDFASTIGDEKLKSMLEKANNSPNSDAR